jgi:dolichol-phosphate mannosyltransferase
LKPTSRSPVAGPPDIGLAALAAAQLGLGLRVVGRLLATRAGRHIAATQLGSVGAGAVGVIVPVLDEADRLPACLEGLVRQGPEVGEIVVVDGGSVDETRAVVRQFSARDPRVRLVETGPIPADWNGKARGLHRGLEVLGARYPWVLTIDADVRPRPPLARSLVAFAEQATVPALSAATLQLLSGAAEGLVHPALLATLVYRFGIPGRATRQPALVQANGQCFLVRRDVLGAVGGFAAVRGSLCEDVTLARRLARAGHAVGFYETDGLVAVRMFAGWREALAGWSRSLPLRDDASDWRGWLGLLELLLVQALPVVVLALDLAGRGVARRAGRARAPGARPRPGQLVARLNQGLLALRLGVLVGTARAYPERPPTYWLSPLADPVVVALVLLSALRRRHTWRGRTYRRAGGGLVAVDSRPESPGRRRPCL